MTTDLVRVLREQADTVSVEFDAADVLASGRRRLLRRRLVGGVAAVVVVTGVALAGASIVRPDDREPPPVATQSMAAASYSTGAVLIRDDRVIDVREPVTSFVRVPAGTVFTSGDGRVRLLPARSVDAVAIGRTSPTAPHLVADPAHDQVAWVDEDAGSMPAYVVYDVARRSIRSSQAGPTGSGTFTPDRARVYALDGDVLYRRDARGAVRVDLRTGEEDVLTPAADEATIASASGDAVAWLSAAPGEGYVVGERFGTGVPTGRHSRPLLSTDGTYVSTDDDRGVHVQRTSDASVVTPTLPASYTRAVAYAWADDDHLLVAAVPGQFDDRHVVDLVFLTCSVAGGDCEQTAEGHSFPATLNLPVGEPPGWLTR